MKVTTLTPEEKEANHFYKKHHKKVPKIINEHVKKKGHVVYGGHARNAVLPTHLKRYTEDYDIGVEEKSKQEATNLKDKLNRMCDGKYFVIHQRKHKGTYGIYCTISRRVVADVSKLEEAIPTFTKSGIKYPTREYQIKNIREHLENPKEEFRHDKDRADLVRLIIAEKLAQLEKSKR
jgi:hypothetical protein